MLPSLSTCLRAVPAALTLASAFALHGGALAAPATYHLKVLEPLTSNIDSQAQDINAAGQVLGYIGSSWSTQAVIWSAGSTAPSLLPLGSQSYASAINDAGVIVGNQRIRSYSDAMVWSGDKATALPTTGCCNDENSNQPSGSAYAINDHNVVAGNVGHRPAVWQNGTVTYLPGSSGYDQGYAHDLNNPGQVVGSFLVYSSGSYSQHAALWQDGTLVDLGALLLHTDSRANAINDSGWVVGEAYFDHHRTRTSRAKLWRDGQVFDLGQLAGRRNTSATDINNLGVIVGWTTSFENWDDRPIDDAVPFMWRHGKMVELASLLDPTELTDAGIVLRVASAINDQGQIVGWGMRNGLQVGYVLTPVPEPQVVLLIAGGLLAVGLFGRRRQSVR
ncbi:MAG: DUF3466 family protein [Rubrivivax sp.]|nr:MAG: DUF3466 family protein [Rubrivivax sp.]